MENNAIYDRIEDLMAKANDIKLAVDAIQTDVTEFGDMLGDIQAFTNETNVVVKDILNGRQISEWIADLAASGKSSATYADASRMQALAEDTDACKNVQVSQHIFDWCVTNNKVGTYYNSIFGAVSGVPWSSLTAPAQVFANATAFGKVANDSTTFETLLNNATAKAELWNQSGVTESVLASSPVALSHLSSLSVSESTSLGGTFNKNMFILTYEVRSIGGGEVLVTLKNGGSVTYGTNTEGRLNAFALRAKTEVGGSSSYPVRSYFDFTYVDFS